MVSEYTDVGNRKKTKRSKLDNFVTKLPYYFSYVILITTWILFTLFISVGEVLLKRREISRFLAQVIIYNILLILTLISLATAANRSPGTPDQSLAPSMVPSHLNYHRTRPAEYGVNSIDPTTGNVPINEFDEDNNDDDDNVPLRYLRNEQWITTRIGKDRPSPLPIPQARSYTPPPNSTTSESDESDSEYSPFPLSAKSPFIPTTAVDAGEDDQDILEETQVQQIAETIEDTTGVEAPLLSSEARQSESSRSLMAKSNNGESRWCKKCQGWKPDRCHHCRHCEQCVLKMDHHCPWVGNCVGYHNYKPFFLFINYALLLGLYATFQAGYETYRFFQDPSGALPYRPIQIEGNSTSIDTTAIATNDTWSDELGISPAIFMMLTVMGGFMSLAVGGLVVFHWYLTLNNQTTLENITHAYPSALLDEIPKDVQWKADYLLTRDERRRLKFEAREINVYNLGWRKNLKNLFLGEDTDITILGVLGAFWPTGRRRRYDGRAGHFFDYNPDHFDKLRELTLELRCGIIPQHRKGQQGSLEDNSLSFDDGSIDDADNDGYELNRMEEKELIDQHTQNKVGSRRMNWFEV
ncbi:uncharacterized protein I206_101683 [Kwoniella pini CBS 10737]|uniref:Palmitoyltransferase n=1 Tax=Kwoniella pini CBS 10737 TaxID=1296096 RepID=A0A1B9HVZ7_9TREE|nr:uncharacterized protein I206_06348 [Kwoniella pini CBS 10737]OCF47447.1 hypothetical protein I206_06348 [Kwoniella pini CBS 10737]